MPALPYFDAETIAASLPWAAAIDAVRRAVATLDLSAAAARTVVAVERGQLMLMPAELGAVVGVKVLSIAPDNPARNRPRIQAVYVLFDAETLTPQALFDGAALTTLRTPAVSAFALHHLARTDASTMAVFGTGPQADAHVQAVLSVRPDCTVTIIGRHPGVGGALVQRLAGSGIAASIGVVDNVRDADIVVCATTARSPLFDGRLLTPHACVIAIGSHEPDVRELDDTVLHRAERIIVEDQATALREAGDIIMAIESGALALDRLTDLRAIVELRPSTGISVFKSVGMGWQDLAIASAIYAAAAG